jgi:hypothetical protein
MRIASLRRVAVAALLLVGAGCAPASKGTGAASDAAELHPLQTRLLARPVPSTVSAGQPASEQELRAIHGGFAPGELENLLAILNRRAAARGEDTIPHCVPLCGPSSPR